jgi:hypothetical protein
MMIESYIISNLKDDQRKVRQLCQATSEIS